MILAPDEDRRWRCSRCDPTIDEDDPGDPDSEDSELQLPDARKRWLRNCDSETNEHVSWDWANDVDDTGKGLRRCPKSYLTAEVWDLVSIWIDWTKFRALPWPGDILDQPMFVYEVIQHCDDLAAKLSAESRGEEATGMQRMLEQARNGA